MTGSTQSDGGAFRSRVLSLFPTGVIVGYVPDADKLNSELRSAIVRKREEHAGNQQSSTVGWESPKGMQGWASGAALDLARHAVAFCDRFTVDQKQVDKPRFRWNLEMWANVYPPMGSKQSHAHPGTLWACVYYVDDGSTGSGADHGGELVLYDPRFPMNQMYAPGVGFRWPDGMREHSNYGIRPTSGMIVAFSGWLLHGVRAYSGKRERISIAMNLMVAPVPDG